MQRNEKKDKDHRIGEDDKDEEEEDDTMDYDWNNEQAKTLCYGNVTLFLLPNPDRIRDLLAMEVDIKHSKGHQKKPKRWARSSSPVQPINTKQIHSKIFVFSKVENLIFNPILLIIVFALINNAFESNIKSVKDIFRIRVRLPRRSLQL